MPAKTKKEIEDIQEKIRVLESIGETERAAELRKELPAAEPAPKPEVHKKEEQTMAEDSGNEFIISGATEEDYNKATSKFAAAGKHLSEAGMPYWKTPNQSIAFPFIIVEDGADNGSSDISIRQQDLSAFCPMHPSCTMQPVFLIQQKPSGVQHVQQRCHDCLV